MNTEGKPPIVMQQDLDSSSGEEDEQDGWDEDEMNDFTP